jgi:SAM-dependent methyltransferase
VADVWAAGKAYEPYVGRWSRAVAREFIDWLAPRVGAAWLDVGCGTGALPSTILSDASPARVCAVDASAAYVAYARSRVQDSRATFLVGDARLLPLPSASADFVVSGLVLNFVPEPARAIAEMKRVARAAGTVAIYVWDYAGEMQLMRHFWDAAVELNPGAAELDEGRRFPICNPSAMEELFRDAGFGAVSGRAIDVPTRFRDFSDYWTPFLGGQGPAPGYAMSLSEEARGKLRDNVRRRLPVAADGSIDLIARAWAIKGVGR